MSIEPTTEANRVGSGPFVSRSFDGFCDELNVTDEEREALVHHLAAMRHRETLKLIDGPIVRAAKAAAERRRRVKVEIANDTNRAGGAPSYHGSRLHQQLRRQADAENDSANIVDVGRAGNGAPPADQPHSNP